MRQHHATKHKHPVEQPALIDRLTDLAAFIYPLTGLPQLIRILQTHQAGGVSLASWIFFGVFEVIFLLYGLKHKIRPLVITQALWLVIDVAVVVAAAAYR